MDTENLRIYVLWFGQENLTKWSMWEKKKQHFVAKCLSRVRNLHLFNCWFLSNLEIKKDQKWVLCREDPDEHTHQANSVYGLCEKRNL